MTEIDEAIRLKHLKQLTYDELLCELLAVIHGDGGQYTDAHGIVESVLQAEKTYYRLVGGAEVKTKNKL